MIIFLIIGSVLFFGSLICQYVFCVIRFFTDVYYKDRNLFFKELIPFYWTKYIIEEIQIKWNETKGESDAR